MIDFHCHLDLYPDPYKVVRNCSSRNLSVLSVTTTPSAWKGTFALAQGTAHIRTALGLHPQIAQQRKGELPLFELLLPQTQYVGEIGLDGALEFKQHWADQVLVFDRILSLCEREGGRILSIHSRRAVTSVLDALQAHSKAGTPILHWFSGNQRELTRAIDQDCWFSVGPAMLNGNKGRALVANMPRDRVLTETDGPFIQIKGQAVMPWEAEQCAKDLAELWSEPVDNVYKQLELNLTHLETSKFFS